MRPVNSRLNLFVQDHISFIVDIPDSARGAHFSLMLLAERYNGRIPNDPFMIARFCGMTKHRWVNKVYPAIQHMWSIDGDTISWEYWSKAIDHCEANRKKLRANSELGGKATAEKAASEEAENKKNADKKSVNTETKNKKPQQISIIPEDQELVDDKPKPHEEMIEIWNETFKGTKIATIRQISQNRIKALKRTFDGKIINKNMDYWRKLLILIKNNEFLSGRGSGQRHWSCSIDWVCKEDNFNKIINGNYGIPFDPTEPENQTQPTNGNGEPGIKHLIKQAMKNNQGIANNTHGGTRQQKAAQF